MVRAVVIIGALLYQLSNLLTDLGLRLARPSRPPLKRLATIAIENQ